jgi:UDP-2,4-diacetamido-2,4,6-trideoxy-beta-L-altropyranose hydrolase
MGSFGTLVVRADASVAIGTGHVMRCLALAQAWQDGGGDVVFAMADSTPAVHERLGSERVEIVHLETTVGSAQDAAQVAALAHARHASWVVVDGYEFGSEFQRIVKNSGLKLLFVDDNGHATHYFADLVLNQNIHASEELYACRENYTRLLLGPHYALLRREFWPWRDWKREIAAMGDKVLVTMGGSDPDNVSFRVIECLNAIKSPVLQITVVIGGSSPHLQKVREAAARNGRNIRLLVEANNVPELMTENDIAIIAGGGTLSELLFMGCAVLSYARNVVQARVVHDLEGMNALRSLGSSEAVDAGLLASTLREVVASKDLRAQMATAGRRMVDGWGVARALQALAPQEISKATFEVTMAPIMPGEREEFLRMAEQHFHELNPLFVPHQDWKANYFEKIQSGPEFFLRWVLARGQRVGFILFGLENHRFLPRKTGAIYELYVIPAQRRKGIARTCARQAIQELRTFAPSKIQLDVMVGNFGAAELWQSLGFRKVTERFVLADGSR